MTHVAIFLMAPSGLWIDCGKRKEGNHQTALILGLCCRNQRWCWIYEIKAESKWVFSPFTHWDLGMYQKYPVTT